MSGPWVFMIKKSIKQPFYKIKQPFIRFFQEVTSFLLEPGLLEILQVLSW